VGAVVVGESSNFLDARLESCALGMDRHRAEEQAKIRGTPPQHQITPRTVRKILQTISCSPYHHMSTGAEMGIPLNSFNRAEDAQMLIGLRSSSFLKRNIKWPKNKNQIDLRTLRTGIVFLKVIIRNVILANPPN
jgi:hypothetical protein